MKKYQIWSEGYRATGEEGGAMLLGEYEGEDFDDAVLRYNEEYGSKHQGMLAMPYTRAHFSSQQAYENRRSNWEVWGCALYSNEAEARKSFG